MKRWEERLKKVEQLAQSFQRNPMVAVYKPRLWPCQPSSVWKLFLRQSLAISFAKSCKETVHVFALEQEKSLQGQRIFLVTSYIELWHYYRTFPQSLMHCYEVIPEGAVCKLYFDLEFHKPSNRGADGVHMVSTLIHFVCERLLEIYGIECSAQNVLNLDSSTEEKFSRHLIFSLENAAFKDNLHVGKFIHAILQQAIRPTKSTLEFEIASAAGSSQAGTNEAKPIKVDKAIESPPSKRCKQEGTDLGFLHVKNKDGQRGFFVDLGVYTKNRNFRLYKSSKAGKNAAFTLADDNKFMARPQNGISVEESIFLASLVCNVSFKDQKILRWDIPEIKGYKTWRPQVQRSPMNPDSLSGCQSSPHQGVDDFILTVVKKDGIEGKIRQWSYFTAEQLLVYDIAKYRWCENVGRFHKSNNIIIVVDLREEVWYQKCHDPECKNFRSSSYPLPQEICMSYLMTLDEEDQAFLMDEVGNIEISQRAVQEPESPVEGCEWGDRQDDQDFSESLNDFEQNHAEIPDQLLLACLADFDSH